MSTVSGQGQSASQGSRGGGSSSGGMGVASLILLIVAATAILTHLGGKSLLNKSYHAESSSINAAKVAFGGKSDTTCRATGKEMYSGWSDDTFWVNLQCVDSKGNYRLPSFRAYTDEGQYKAVQEGGIYRVHLVSPFKKPNIPKFTFTPANAGQTASSLS